MNMKTRFRGYLPVVIDVETGGFDCHKNALLEIGVVPLTFNEQNQLTPLEGKNFHLEPEKGLEVEQAALDFTGIKLHNPFRMAVSEKQALTDLFKLVREQKKQHECQRAVLVGHNAWFDLGFINAATQRQKIKRSPFHPFTSFDTATLSGLAFGQTVLARACAAANIEFSQEQAHGALYDAQKTAELFCYIINQWHDNMGWPAALVPEE